MQIHHIIQLIFWVLFSGMSLQAQVRPNIGNPFILNFPKQEYLAGTQNWDFTQDGEGIIYVANNEGLLAYDGLHWKIYPLPNKTIVRSVAFDPQTDRIYVGGQDEVGYFEKDKNGFLQFHSIKPHIPEAFRSMEDVWTLVQQPGELYFQASDNLYRFANDTVQIHPSTGQFIFLGKWKEQLIVQKTDGELFLLGEDMGLTSLGQLSQAIVGACTMNKGQLLMATEKNGLYEYQEGNGISPWKSPADPFLLDKRIHDIALLHNQHIAIATALGGILILNQDRYPHHWIDKNSGLQNNMIRSLYEDRDHNLWLGLDNGIDFLALADPITFFYPDGELEGTSYDIEILEEDIYIGTSNGLYHAPWQSYYNPLQSRNIFSSVPGAGGQVWGLDQIGDDLFMGHHEGAFLVKEQMVEKLSPGSGYWLFVDSPGKKDRVIAGSYYGLNVLEKNENNNWRFQYPLEGFEESSRFIIKTGEDEYWVSHPYRGVFRMRPDYPRRKVRVKAYGKAAGLPKETGNQAFRIWGEIVVGSEPGLYKYNAQTDDFQPYTALNEIIGEKNTVRRLFEDAKNNLWYITQEKIGYIKIEDQGLQKAIKNYELPGIHSMLMGGFELIYPHDSNSVFMGAEKGMILLDPSQVFNQEHHFKTRLNSISLIEEKDTILFANQINENYPDSILLELPNRSNSFRFTFSATNFSPFYQVSYQYKLEGYDEEWSGWSDNNFREYTNLPPGKYTFMARSGIPGQYLSNTACFTFYINHPWYASPTAYGIYSFLFLLGIAGLIWIPRQRFKKEKALLEKEKEQKVALHRAEVRQSREELMLVKNEKLNAEIDHKNKELASTTMHLLQKSELIQKLRTELDRLKRLTENQEAKKELRRIMGLLRDDAQLDEEWEQFFHHFDKVHSNFFKRLKEQFPQLTAKDQKLCAYLRMNLTSKDIAPLMNISVRGVEISRYRLRKKLDLDTEVNLNEFMMEF